MHALITNSSPPVLVSSFNDDILVHFIWDFYIKMTMIKLCQYWSVWAVLLIIIWFALYKSFPKALSTSVDFLCWFVYVRNTTCVPVYQLHVTLLNLDLVWWSSHRSHWGQPRMSEVVLGQMEHLKPGTDDGLIELLTSWAENCLTIHVAAIISIWVV